jgi:hypothetical protein
MRRLMLGVALALAAAGVAAADEKAEAVVKKAIEAHGGADNLNKYTAERFTMKGEVDVMGTFTEFTGGMAHAPDRFRMDFSMQVMGMNITFRQVVNGDKAKRTVKVGDMDVPAGDVEKDELKMAQVGHQAQRLTPLLDPKLFTLRAGDDEDVNGKKAAVVVATPKAIDKEVKLYFDKESGLLVKFGHQGKGPGSGGARVDVYVESYQSEFKKVNGLQVATKLQQDHDGKKFLTATLSDYELLEKLDDSEFKVDD